MATRAGALIVGEPTMIGYCGRPTQGTVTGVAFRCRGDMCRQVFTYRNNTIVTTGARPNDMNMIYVTG